MNKKLTNKDVGSAVGLPIGVVLVWLIGMAVVVPPEVATAIGSICSFGVAYLIKENN